MTDRLSKLESAKIAHSDAVRAKRVALHDWLGTTFAERSAALAARERYIGEAVKEGEAYAAVLALLQEEAK